MIGNTRIVLAAHPEGLPRSTDFRVESVPVKHPAAGEVLLRTVFLSLDPYVRGRLGAGMTYGSTAGGLSLGDVVIGGTVSEVVESRAPGIEEGELVLASGGWQEYSIQHGSGITRIDTGGAPVSTALGVLGMPGFTGYVGLRVVARPLAGQCVVISAAGGAVGATAGQLAKQDGARVIGIAGGAEKTAWLRSIGFDAAVDHRSPTFADDVAAVTPDGVDVSLENVGGPVLEALLPRFNPSARIALCGLVSRYNGERDGAGLDASGLLSAVLSRQLSVRGFSFPPFLADHHADFRREVGAGVASGAIRYREDIRHGLEQAPEAFIGLFGGGNTGKLLVQLAELPESATTGSVSPTGLAASPATTATPASAERLG